MFITTQRTQFLRIQTFPWFFTFTNSLLVKMNGRVFVEEACLLCKRMYCTSLPVERLQLLPIDEWNYLQNVPRKTNLRKLIVVHVTHGSFTMDVFVTDEFVIPITGILTSTEL